MVKSKVGAEPKKKELDVYFIEMKEYTRVFIVMNLVGIIAIIIVIVLVMVISFIEEKV